MTDKEKLEKLKKSVNNPNIAENLKADMRKAIEKLEGKINKEMEVKKVTAKKKGVKSILPDEPKKSDEPNCDELLEKYRKRKAQSKKYAKRKPDTPAEILKKAAERAKSRVKKSPSGKPTKAQTSSIEKAIEDFLVLIKNDKEAIKKLISKLQKLL